MQAGGRRFDPDRLHHLPLHRNPIIGPTREVVPVVRFRTFDIVEKHISHALMVPA